MLVHTVYICVLDDAGVGGRPDRSDGRRRSPVVGNGGIVLDVVGKCMSVSIAIYSDRLNTEHSGIIQFRRGKKKR